MILVDASVWIDALVGRSTGPARWLVSDVDRRSLGLTDLTLCEILQGARDDRHARQLHERLMAFSVFATGGGELAEEAAANYRRLRRLGVTVRNTVDLWIASYCIREGHSLLHSDHDYDAFEEHLGLIVVSS